MTTDEFYKRFSSDCTAGSAAQVLAKYEEPITRTGRVYYRLSHGGEQYALLFTNTIDSTFSDGSISHANDTGKEWQIHSVRVGLVDTLWAEPDTMQEMTFDGSVSRTVSSGERFCSDPMSLHASAGQYLCYEISFSGTIFPYHEEMTLTAKIQDGDRWTEDKHFPVPVMIGCDRPVALRVGFLGDSITQGCGTVYDSYTHWPAKIAEGLPSEYSVWDLGIGYARGYDAATDGGWLSRAKHCDIVNVCFGVNDIFHGSDAEKLTADLRTITRSLHRAGCRVILFTVPPFDMTGEDALNWYRTNDAIRRELSKECDRVFDFARVLGRPAPFSHCSVYGGHPNAEGCAVVAKVYLEEIHL